MGLRCSSTGMRHLVWIFLAAVFMTLLLAYSPSAFAASSWRAGAGGTDDPAALGFEPLGIDYDPVNGYLFVTDSDNGVVNIFNTDGTPTGMALAPTPGLFTETLAVKFDGGGHVYVADKSYLYRFDVSYSSGSYSFGGMIKWNGSGILPTTLNYPQGIAVYGNDLYVADTLRDRVLKFDASLFSSTSNPDVWSGDLDPDPDKDATLVSPLGIAADSSGVYIGNHVNGVNGKIIKVKTGGGTIIKPLNYPTGFTLHTDGNLYVAVHGSSDSLVTRFDPNLNESSVYFTGSPTAIALAHIAFDSTGALYLSTYAQSPPWDPEYDTIWKLQLGSPDNRLAGLTISGGALSPSPFSPGTQQYTANVASSVTATTVTPVLSDTAASVTVNGSGVTNGNASPLITLQKGDNAIPVIVTAINGAKRTYTITVTRAPYTDATLSALSLSNGTLNETFDPTGIITSYTADVANSVSAISVTATVNNSRASLEVNNTGATSSSAFGPIPLAVGPNTITVTGIAEDGVTKKDYTITVTRAASAVATLNGLTVSPGALSEPFASGTTLYTVSVANSVAAFSLAPTVTDSTATLKVNGATAVSGSVYGPIPLSVGPNTITVTVTAQDNTTKKDYILTVTRAPSIVATLDGLTVSPGSPNEPFASGTTLYTVSVANTVAAISVTPTVTDNTATLKVNGYPAVSGSVYGPVPLDVGPNTITVTVTAQDGVTSTPYAITVTRAGSSDATLSSLAISQGTLNEPFTSGTTAYSANVDSFVTSISVTPVAADNNASLTVNGVPAASGSTFGPIALQFGANTVSLVITAQDGTQRSYRIDIWRNMPASSSSGPAVNAADLLTLCLLADEHILALSPAFTGTTLDYSAETTAPSIKLAAKALYLDAVMMYSGNKLQDQASIDLQPGDNTIELQVAHPSGGTRTYTITIRRSEAAPSTPIEPAGTAGQNTTQTPQTATINDIAGSWAEAEIRNAVASGWVSGYPDGSFHPEREVTRAEFVQLLAKALGWTEGAASDVPNYTDLDNIGLWARPAIAAAVQQGIINGYEDGSFRPDRPLTRAEMAVFVTKTLGLATAANSSASFADNASIPAWVMPYIAKAVDQGLVNGLDNNRFAPDDTATRAQAVVIISRLLSKK
ncbi:cadherin-like beta sandwich domain-containing protein [Paenibacillus thalictri]|uniref:SLH domain-containing protein n=1 Tax=Paenibacillus thalictri TaxID=2527873 RepID=A0A4Q9DNC9_9BACL|nr:cadherin-like beta sandwich domain-containing protein [Paenibacillus thalictri]TBL73953.1 hypothetical protein EYB31_26005 [Paenibacillus thalictri]